MKAKSFLIPSLVVLLFSVCKAQLPLKKLKKQPALFTLTQPKLFPSKLSEKKPLFNLYKLPQDNMPCIVPDGTLQDSSIVYNNQAITDALNNGRMPNGYYQKRETYMFIPQKGFSTGK